MTRPERRRRCATGVRIPLLLCGMLVWAACAPGRPPVAVLPEGVALAPDDARLERVLRDYRAETAARRGLRGSARVALDGPDWKLDRPQRIAVERPGRLRFEILALFDQLAAILATDGERYDFFDASTGEIRRGRVTSSLLWDLTRIDLDPEEVVDLLLAAPVPGPGTALAGAWLEPSGRLAIAFAWPTEAPSGACAADDPWAAARAPECEVAARALAESGGELFFFDLEGRLVELRAIEPGGALRYRAFFEEFTTLPAPTGAVAGNEGVIFPKRVTLESPNIGSEARFVWKRVVLADELSDRLFRIPAPRGGG